MSNTAAQPKILFTCRIPLRWGDMDAYGHINNTNYFRYMEQARVEWLESLDRKCWGDGVIVVVATAACTFLKPMAYPGTVEVSIYVEEPSRSSVMTHYDQRLEGDTEARATGTAKMVWVDEKTGKTTPIPDVARAALS
ncbi:MAG TPA: thioesterase family protein [Rhodocyclaceae bacterium]|nr:thioesterase family protein [Rhodocyclaceae bacterium]